MNMLLLLLFVIPVYSNYITTQLQNNIKKQVETIDFGLNIEQKYFPNCTKLVSHNNIFKICVPLMTCFEFEHSCHIIDKFSNLNCTDKCCSGNYDFSLFSGNCYFCCEDYDMQSNIYQYFIISLIILGLLPILKLILYLT